MNKLAFDFSPLEELLDEKFRSRGLRVFVKRDDLLHPEVSGNKWRKLKYHIQAYQKGAYQGILSFGGAFSNHLAATAAACHELGIKSVGIIRGKHVDIGNPTLSHCMEHGMELRPVSIAEYDKYARNAIAFPGYESFMKIIEGGEGKLGVKGCSEIKDEIEEDFDTIMVPIGTGTSFIGVLESLEQNQKIIGVSAVKGADIHSYIEEKIVTYELPKSSNWTVIEENYFGGFAKVDKSLLDFKKDFEAKHGIVLDYIYTAKMFYHLFRLIEEAYFKEGSKIICIHTGGIQGNKGMEMRLKL